jgi:pimeloyl-ACP methyl ester carboxylesterase
VCDVIDFIELHAFKHVVLVGHRYSGCVAGIVAATHPDTIQHVIYVEAFLPSDGKSLLDITGLDSAHEVELIQKNGGRWPHPTYQELHAQPLMTEHHIHYLLEQFVDHPGKTITARASLTTAVEHRRSTYIGSRCPSRIHPSDPRCKMTYIPLNKGHWPMITAKEDLGGIIIDVLKNLPS